jgi:hypothetical protein
MQLFLFPLIRAAELAHAGVGAHLRYPGELLSPENPRPAKYQILRIGARIGLHVRVADTTARRDGSWFREGVNRVRIREE